MERKIGIGLIVDPKARAGALGTQEHPAQEPQSVEYKVTIVLYAAQFLSIEKTRVF